MLIPAKNYAVKTGQPRKRMSDVGCKIYDLPSTPAANVQKEFWLNYSIGAVSFAGNNF